MTTIKDGKWAEMRSQKNASDEDLASRIKPVIEEMLGSIGVDTKFGAPFNDQQIVAAVKRMAKEIWDEKNGQRSPSTPNANLRKDKALSSLIAPKIEDKEYQQDEDGVPGDAMGLASADALTFAQDLRKNLKEAIDNGRGI